MIGRSEYLPHPSLLLKEKESGIHSTSLKERGLGGEEFFISSRNMMDSDWLSSISTENLIKQSLVEVV